jgi:chromosome partitioning protein
MRTITIANNKGGVGKTTSTLNIGVGLANKGKKVLLVDADPQGNLTDNFIRKNDLTNTIKELIEGDKKANEVIIKDVRHNIDLIPSNNMLNGTETQIINTISKETLLLRALEPIKNNYDYILIDSAPSLNVLTLNCLTAGDEVIIPIQAGYYSLTGTNDVLKTIAQVKQLIKPDLKIGGVLLTMYDERNNMHKEVLETLKIHFKDTLFKTIIRRNIKLDEAVSHHLDIYNYDPSSNGAIDYMSLVEEILEKESI